VPSGARGVFVAPYPARKAMRFFRLSQVRQQGAKMAGPRLVCINLQPYGTRPRCPIAAELERPGNIGIGRNPWLKWPSSPRFCVAEGQSDFRVAFLTLRSFWERFPVAT